MGISGTQKAPLYALSKVARSGATRSGYVSGLVFISVGGIQMGNKRTPGAPCIQLESLTITDELNETPNTCTFRVNWTVPAQGSEVIITLGSTNNTDRLFAGHVLSSTQSYFEKPVNLRSDVAAVDYTWQFGFPKVTKRYTNQSASAIALDLIATYAAVNGFTGTNVAANLPALDEITYTNEDLGEAMTRLARRIGGYWYVDYRKDVHLFFTDTGQPPAALVPTHRSLANVTKDTDRSQALTRVYVEGRGSRILSAVTAGDTRIPVDAVDMFSAAADVFLKVSFQGASGGAQHLSFTGVIKGGEGAIVGPGVTPSSPPTVTLAAGTGIELGAHGYAFTWVTPSGETKPSALASVTHIGAPTTPTTATTAVNDSADGASVNELESGAWKPGDTVDWAYSYARSPSHTGGTPISPTVSRVAVVSNNWWNSPGNSARAMIVGIVYSPDPQVTDVYVWHRVNGGSWRVWAYAGNPAGFKNIPGGSVFQYTFDAPATYSMSGTPPVSGTPSQRTTISGIAVGPSTVTARKVYRTVANGSQLKLQQTIANNTATTGVVDSTPDASLGANAPTSDTSAIPQPEGTVLPHASSIRVTSTAPFDDSGSPGTLLGGGWAIVGNGEQVIRYAQLTSGNLIGIPIEGIGSIVAPISYGASITAAPMVIGIPTTGPRSILSALVAGDEVYLVVQVDDGARQAQLAAALGGNGIREEWVQDRRLSIPEARARGNATLADRVLDQIRVSYTSRDLHTRSGKDIVVNLPAPTNIVGTFKIQHVTISNFRPYPTQYPTFAVQASSSRFSFEDLLRVATRDVSR